MSENEKRFKEYQDQYFEFDLEGVELELVHDCWLRQQKKIDKLELALQLFIEKHGDK